MGVEEGNWFLVMAEEDNIKKIIKEVPELILKDIDSFLLLRTDGNLLLHQYKLGGGNILALMGQFSVLNFQGFCQIIL